ncbi:hypothetical protein [Tsuneonella sp. HG222]
MRSAAAFALALLLASCGAGEAEPEAQPATTPTATAAEPAAETPAGPAVALDIGGLRLVDPGSGKTTALSFGMPRSTVDAIVAKATGQTAELSHLGECPAGPMDFSAFGALKLHFMDGEFVGWSLDEGLPRLTTMDGIGIGSTRREVEAARTIAMVEGSTLGAEFTLTPSSGESNLSGIFDGDRESAKVQVLWAGIACNFR